jgi:unsaturated rhamnogalacturonyl hydrolase
MDSAPHHSVWVLTGIRFQRLRCRALIAGLLILTGCAHRASDVSLPGDLVHWPAGCSPRDIGKRVAERYLASPFGGFGRLQPVRYIPYPETCTWYGALTFSRFTEDPVLRDQLIARFAPLFDERKDLVPEPVHVDLTVFAAVPLELSIQTHDRKYLDLGRHMADQQWEEPSGLHATAEAVDYFRRGLSWQTRMWIDDMFMITAVQAQAFRATGEWRYINRAAREMVAYLDSLQQPNGLFFHAPDVPFFWGRGNGWMAAGMSELLRSLPEDNPDRPRILEGYRVMMASLLRYQRDDGMWRQLIDRPESWPETSCSAMFTFALISGVRNHWLDEEEYGPAARKGWLGVIRYLNENGDISDVCEGTGKKNDLQYYLDRKRNVGDMHGQAPILWCATALLR